MPALKVPSVREVKCWPVTVSVVEAGRCWSMGKDECYRKAATGELAPGVPVLKLGRSLRVARAHVLAALGIVDSDEPAPQASPAQPTQRQPEGVNHATAEPLPGGEPADGELMLPPKEAARMLRVGRTTMHGLLRDGEVESVLVGRSRRVPVAALHEYVDRLRAQQRQTKDR